MIALVIQEGRVCQIETAQEEARYQKLPAVVKVSQPQFSIHVIL